MKTSLLLPFNTTHVCLYAVSRYEILTPNAIPKGFMDGKQACERMARINLNSKCQIIANGSLRLESQLIKYYNSNSKVAWMLRKK